MLARVLAVTHWLLQQLVLPYKLIDLSFVYIKAEKRGNAQTIIIH